MPGVKLHIQNSSGFSIITLICFLHNYLSVIIIPICIKKNNLQYLLKLRAQISVANTDR